jgi:hypothetical protein
MQIKLNLRSHTRRMVEEDHIIEVPDGSDFLTIFCAITKAMRDECIYEDEIQSITFDGDPS